MNPAVERISPEIARKNLILGLSLGGFCLLVTIIFIIRFTFAGLPPDRKMVEENRRRAEARSAPAEVIPNDEQGVINE